MLNDCRTIAKQFWKIVKRLWNNS